MQANQTNGFIDGVIGAVVFGGALAYVFTGKLWEHVAWLSQFI